MPTPASILDRTHVALAAILLLGAILRLTGMDWGTVPPAVSNASFAVDEQLQIDGRLERSEA